MKTIKDVKNNIDEIVHGQMMAFNGEEWDELSDLVDTSPLAAQHFCIAIELLQQAMHTLEIADIHLTKDIAGG